MSLTFSLAIYLLCWWVVLFAVLPFGIKTQSEEGDVVAGTTESAPVAPRIIEKMIYTTLISAVIFAIIYIVIEYQLLSLDDIPFLPKYSSQV